MNFVLVILKEPPAVEIFIISATLRRVKEKSPVSLGQTIQLVCIAVSNGRQEKRPGYSSSVSGSAVPARSVYDE